VLVIVRVAVLVIVAVGVIMVMVTMVVLMTVGKTVPNRRGIGITLRFERRIDEGNFRAQTFQQCLDRWVALKPQPPIQHLHWHVAVAEMPGKARKRRKISGARLDQRLGLGHHLDQAAIVKLQRIVGAKPHGLGEIELDAGPLDAEQEALVRLPLGERQDQSVNDGGVPPLGSR
jgi:hypothetical protein